MTGWHLLDTVATAVGYAFMSAMLALLVVGIAFTVASHLCRCNPDQYPRSSKPKALRRFSDGGQVDHASHATEVRDGR